MTPNGFRERAQEIALWLYGPDEGLSEGLVRTLIDRIEAALTTTHREATEAENERCAKIAEDCVLQDPGICGESESEQIAAAIRKKV